MIRVKRRREDPPAESVEVYVDASSKRRRKDDLDALSALSFKDEAKQIVQKKLVLKRKRPSETQNRLKRRIVETCTLKRELEFGASFEDSVVFNAYHHGKIQDAKDAIAQKKFRKPVDYARRDKITLLMSACRHGDETGVLLFLSLGADPLGADCFGRDVFDHLNEWCTDESFDVLVDAAIREALGDAVDASDFVYDEYELDRSLLLDSDDDEDHSLRVVHVVDHNGKHMTFDDVALERQLEDDDAFNDLFRIDHDDDVQDDDDQDSNDEGHYANDYPDELSSGNEENDDYVGDFFFGDRRR